MAAHQLSDRHGYDPRYASRKAKTRGSLLHAIRSGALVDASNTGAPLPIACNTPSRLKYNDADGFVGFEKAKTNSYGRLQFI